MTAQILDASNTDVTNTFYTGFYLYPLQNGNTQCSSNTVSFNPANSVHVGNDFGLTGLNAGYAGSWTATPQGGNLNVPSLLGQYQGYYCVWGFVDNGNAIYESDKSDNVILFQSPILYGNAAGITNLTVAGNVSVYPNPAVSDVTIALTDDLQSDKLSISVYTTTGQLVKDLPAEVHGASVTLDVSQWAKGTYLIRIQDSKGGMMTKPLSKI